jgi:hypothetical protein
LASCVFFLLLPLQSRLPFQSLFCSAIKHFAELLGMSARCVYYMAFLLVYSQRFCWKDDRAHDLLAI